VFNIQYASGGFFDDLIKKATKPKEGNDEATVVSGLKEALRIGTANAVDSVSKENGYLGNVEIKIPVPEKLKRADKMLRKIGMGDSVDEFIESMNRAAETAAPQALDIFVGAVKDMDIIDAFDILSGDDTAATKYFEEKTSDDLYGLFKPVVTDTMGQTGVVQSYKKMIKKYTSLPWVKEEPVDLEDYVTTKALEGLFFMVGEEEKKIRKDPAARVTELLQKVFGGY